MSVRVLVPVLFGAALVAGGVVFLSGTGGLEVSGSEVVGSPVEGRGVVSEGAGVVEATGVAEMNRFVGVTDSAVRWQVRVDQLRRMDGADLNDTEVEFLFGVLRHVPEAGREEDWWVVVNEVMEQLRKQGVGRERLTDVFVGIIEDGSAPEVLRDYAVQHLGLWVSRKGEVLGEVFEKDAGRVEVAVRAIGEVAGDARLGRSSVPGTALMVLVNLRDDAVAGEYVGEVFDGLERRLGRVISGSDSGSSVVMRTSAINAVGMMERREHLPAVRRLVAGAETDDSVRLSSIAALGFFGEDADRAMLRGLVEDGGKFRHAAVAALGRLERE